MRGEALRFRLDKVRGTRAWRSMGVFFDKEGWKVTLIPTDKSIRVLALASMKTQRTRSWLIFWAVLPSQRIQRVDIFSNSCHMALRPVLGYTESVRARLHGAHKGRRGTFCFLRRHSVHDFASRRRVLLTVGAVVCCIAISGNDASPAGMDNSSFG